MYQTYAVYCVGTGLDVGTVAAQSPDEAVYRLMGGEWGRADYAARLTPAQ